MRREPLLLCALPLLASLGLACGSGDTNSSLPVPKPAPAVAAAPANTGRVPGDGVVNSNASSNGADPNLASNPNIAGRVVDYGEAFRTASLKLVGELPALADIKTLAAAANPADQQALYEAFVDQMIADPRFAATQIVWWRNTFKTGGPAQNGGPSFDTAATFAAEVVVNDRPYTDLFTAASGTCPSYDATSNTFTAAECGNNAPTAGVLTDPGLMAQFFSNMAMRRARFIQETFVCQKFPAEYSTTPIPMGVSLYTSPWDFATVAGGPTAKINFQDTSALVCANCHTTINHFAPLFGYFDANGQYMAGQMQVQTPVTPPVTSTITDWLVAGQGFAWRHGEPVTDIPSLGQAISKDPAVALCAVNRIWNWAFSRGDIVNDLATVPPVVTADLTTAFVAGGMKLKSVIRSVFTSDDFVRF